jgi:ABC-2 type transport system ATP-binding protein
MTAMVQCENLTKRFGQFAAVTGVSFSVDSGSVVGFLGPNGSGKTTTMRMITGFLPPSEGRAIVCGFDVAEFPREVKKRIGYLPEGAPLYEDMTPASFLKFVAEVRGYSGSARDKAVAEVVEKLRVREVLYQPIGTLSKGFKRRVAVAQAVLHDPEVLILDEPTDGLDPNQKHEVRQRMRQMAQDLNRAIIISTHILEEADAVCTRAIVISRGKIVADETIEELVSRSRYHNAVSLRVDGDHVDKLHAELAGISDVASVDFVDRSSPVAHLMVMPRNGKSILEEVSARVRNGNFPIEEIRAERGHLDDVFRQLTVEG